MGKTIAEKIFDSHQVDEPIRGTLYGLTPVFCHEITTPIGHHRSHGPGQRPGV